MSTALTTYHQSEAELLEVLQSSLYPGASDASVKMVLGYCKASGLDPMQKPVHIVPMWDQKAGKMRDVVMPGIGLYRTQAARTGCAGVTEPEFGPDVTENIGGVDITYPAWCRVTVKRKLSSGEIVDFTAKEFWRENYAVKGGKERSIAPNAMWQKRPYGQVAKCAEAQALRKAFPEIGSEPTADEMAGKTLNEFDTVVDSATGEITPRVAAPADRPALPTWPADKFAEQLPRWTKAIQAGLKTHDEILTLARSKGELTTEQVKAIHSVNAAKAAEDITDVTPKGEEPMTAAEQEARDDFVRDMS